MEVQARYRRSDRTDQQSRAKDDETDTSYSGKGDPMRINWGNGFVRLVFVCAIIWVLLILFALLFHLWSCHSSISFLSALCRKDSRVLVMLDSMGLAPKPLHRCPIPVLDDPKAVVIPEKTPDTIPKKLSYVEFDKKENGEEEPFPLFGGHQSWAQREETFKLKNSMKVHCGFIKGGGGEMEDIDKKYLWRGKHTFAVAQHKHHKSIYEEGDAIKRGKRYARPLIDLHMKIYYYEGMRPWSPNNRMPSDIPEGVVLIREHTTMTNLFSCLWFNEVNLFTPRDQLSFGYVVYRLREAFKPFMFQNCEYNSLFILHRHTREHSSKVEWVKSLDEFKGDNSGLKESKAGLAATSEAATSY